MIIVLKPDISKKQETTILKEIRKRGYKPHVMRGVARIVIGAIGGLENPKRFAVIGDLHGLARARHALDLERLANERAQRNRFHTVRQ